MDSVIFLIMRRMRIPLLVLLSVYVIATLGFMVVPGVNGKGMDFFHALYFVSFMSTTIGFGEISGAGGAPFSTEQRMWTLFCIYLTVISWVYSIGVLMSLIQDEALRRALTERRFAQTVRRISEPFYLICGYGDTGQALVKGLEERYLRAVVVEVEQTRINALTMENYPIYVPRLCADAGRPWHLVEGGLNNKYCAGVVAMTDKNEINLHVAITSKLLNERIKVICRVDSHDVTANMASFGTDYTVNPFDIFAVQLHSAINSPSLHRLREWLTCQSHQNLSIPLRPPPAKGLWILCSYGRFGKAVYNKLSGERGIKIVTIESSPQSAGHPKGEFVVGLGTEAKTLQEARIEEAVGIVAGTDDDGNNLSIVMTSKILNSNLFVVLRQNRSFNAPIFEAAHADIVMQPSLITANHVRSLLITPMLIDFFRLGKARGEVWAALVLRRLRKLFGRECDPVVWESFVNEDNMPAIFNAFQKGLPVTLECITRNPRERTKRLACVPLLLIRKREKILLPEDTETIQENDKILWCGTQQSKRAIRWTLFDESVFYYITTGEAMPRSHVFRWWQEHVQHKIKPPVAPSVTDTTRDDD